MTATEGHPETGKVLSFVDMTFDEQAVEVRGCSFQHTAEREQFMSEVVNALLTRQARGRISGVCPVGYWRYELDEADPAPEAVKACGLFRTLGERRLASHLLEGLEMLHRRLVGCLLYFGL